MLDLIGEEIGDELPLDIFHSAYRYAAEKPHGFLFIDFNPKQPWQKLRSQWHEFIDVSRELAAWDGDQQALAGKDGGDERDAKKPRRDAPGGKP